MIAHFIRPRGIARQAALLAALLGSLIACPELPAADSTPLEIQLAGWVDEGADVVKPNRTSPGQALPAVELSLPGEETPSTLEDSDLEEEPEVVDSHFYLQHRAGNLAGQPLPYTTLGTFQPYNLDDGIVFLNAQVLVDNFGNAGGGLSLGRRWYDADANRLFGIAGSYDGQQSSFSHTFQQLALTLESRGDLWDLFANGYLPMGGEAAFAGQATPTAPRFAGNNLVIDLLDLQRASLSGCDVTLARRVGESNLWAFGGWYHLSGGGSTTNGATGGVRGYMADRVACDLGVSDDPLYGTNVGFSITLFFGGTSGGLVSPPNVYQRMAEPLVRRNAPLVRDALAVASTEPLTQGGIPITFTHVNGAGPGGTGTFENPFGTLNDATGSTSRIVLLHADSVFNNEGYALAPGQRLLGQGTGLGHGLVTDQLGPITIPDANGGVNAPLIANSPGPAIVAASITEISGLRIQNPVGPAVLIGNTVNGTVDVNRVLITNGGVQATGATGNITFTNVGINGSPGPGMSFSNINGSVTVEQSTITGSGGPGIVMNNVNIALLDSVGITNATGPSVAIAVGGTGTMNASVRDSTFAGGGGPSTFGFLANAGAVLNLNLFNNDDDIGFQLARDNNGFTRLGGTIGVGGFFNNDNGNVAANGNTTNGGAPNVPIFGAGNQIEIINPGSIPLPP